MALITQNRVAASGRSAASGRRQIQIHTNSVHLDGSNGKGITITDDPSMDSPSEFAMRIVAKRTGATTGTDRLMHTAGGPVLSIYLGASGIFGFAKDSDAVSHATPAQDPCMGDWHEYILTVGAGGAFAFYIDGVLADSATVAYTGNFSPAGSLVLGNQAALNQTFHGNIAEAQFWAARSLSAHEVSKLYTTGTLPYKADLAVDLQFTEGSGSTIADTSGNGNDGTLNGGTWTTDVPSKARTART